jgi:D-alanyl-D-alanine carboxypeptidase
MGLWYGAEPSGCAHVVPVNKAFVVTAGKPAELGVLLFALAVGLGAAARPAWARIHASIVIDADSGQVLEEFHADKPCYPASLTKLMTLYLTFSALRQGKLTLNKELRVSARAAGQSPTKLCLKPGGFISVKSAILALVTKSANDAAVVLAEALAGTEPRFAGIMTHTAHHLGMSHTTFRNASGLPNPRQRTTARDLARLANALIHEFPEYYHFFSVRSFVFRGKTIHGHDHLLGRFRGADGLKTGYIRASGFNLVTSAVRDDNRLIGVVIGGR